MLLRGGSTAETGIFAQIQANLYGVNSDGSVFLTDGNLIQYSEQYTNKIDGLDARKLDNSAENFGILSGGKRLVIERRKAVNESDTIHYQLTGVRNQNYRMEVTANGLSSYGYQGYVEDTYLQTATLLSSEGKTLLVVHHDLATVKAYFDQVILINQRIVAYGDTETTFVKENISKTYGSQHAVLLEAGI